MTFELVPASRFSIEELTDLYNQTRVDYLVPMPMNAGRLAEYVHDFDVDLDRSCVARSPDGQVIGLGMLAIRENLAWITRLGVLPVSRRGGTGEILMNGMLQHADRLGMEETHLEVIKNNEPAHHLFMKKGFKDVDEYLVMRRAPRAIISDTLVGRVEWLNRNSAIEKLESYPRHLTWITAVASMKNAPSVEGIQVNLPDGDMGWLVYRAQKFFVSHLTMHTVAGRSNEVGIQLLKHLYLRYPRVDTYAENIHVKDPHLPAFQAMSYFANFSRIEMRRNSK